MKNTKSSKKEKELHLLDECFQKGRKNPIVREYWNLVYSAVSETLRMKRIHFSPEDVEDLRNIVFIQLFDKDSRRLRLYKPEGNMSLAGWIRLIAVRTVLNELRKKGYDSISWRRNKLTEEFILENETRGEPVFAMDSLEPEISEAMEKLADGERYLLKLHYYHDVPLPEIAGIMNKSIGSVYTMKSRALKKLKEVIETSPELKKILCKNL
jgi:RNA polymerase sigma factor (sigma-70 family)